MSSEFLAELFASRVRAEVLSQLVPRPHRGFSLTELSRALGLPISSLQHECYKLERIGVLSSRREGSSRRYSISPDCPVRVELTALVVAALGQDEALRATLENTDGLVSAFVAAELPIPADLRGDATTTIPLVLIGELQVEDIDAIQARAGQVLGLPPTRLEAVFYTPDDWRERVEQHAPYAVWLLEGPRTQLVGTLD